MTTPFSIAGTKSKLSSMMLMLTWVAILLTLWTYTSTGSFVPSPLKVIQAFPDLWFHEGLGVAIYESMITNLEAVAIMFMISYTIAVLTVVPIRIGKKQVFRPFATLVSSGRFNGMVGLPLVFTAIFHNNYQAVKVSLLVFGMGVFTVLSLTQMIKDIPKDRFDHSRTLRMGEWRVIWEVVILGSFDKVIDITKINMAMGWMMLPIVEGRFKFSGGVGALLENESKHFAYDAVFAAVAAVLVVGLCQDFIVTFFKNTVCAYSSIGMENV